MDSDEGERDLGEKIDQFLSEGLDDYEPPSEEDIEEWLEKAPDRSEAAAYEGDEENV